MTDLKYRNSTVEMVAVLCTILGVALEDGRKILHIDENKNPDGTLDTIEVKFS